MCLMVTRAARTLVCLVYRRLMASRLPMLALLLASVISCSGASELVQSSSDQVRSQPLDRDEPGVTAAPPFPVSPGTAMDSVEEGVFVFVGQHFADARANKAALYEPRRDRWELTAPPPFKSVLWSPVATASEERVFVAGRACDERGQAESATVPCEPGGVEAAVYDAAADTWELLPALTSMSNDADAWFVDRLGEATLLGVGDDLFMLTDGAERWMELPQEPLTANRRCVAGGLLLAIGSLLDPPSTSSGDPPPDRYDPLVATVFDPSSGAWSHPVPSGTEYPQMTGFTFACTPDGVVAVPFASRTVAGEEIHAHRFEPAGSWSTLAVPHEPELLGTVVAADVRGDVTLVETTYGRREHHDPARDPA